VARIEEAGLLRPCARQSSPGVRCKPCHRAQLFERFRGCEALLGALMQPDCLVVAVVALPFAEANLLGHKSEILTRYASDLVK
jgi:hypothetical protein